MTIDLTAIQPQKSLLPPRIVMYGPPKCGKTTLTSTIPGNIILDVEGGSGFVTASRIEKQNLDNYEKFMNVLGDLYTQNHSFTSFSVDSVDWLETLIFNQAAKEHGKTSIADVGYGAGYATAQNIWAQVLSAFDDLRIQKGMMPILVAHEAISRYDNPLTESYDRFTLKLRSNDKGSSSVSIVKEWTDALLFVNKEVFVKKQKEGLKEVKKAGTSERVFFHTQESPAYLAGNRFGLPAQIPFDWASLSAALNAAMTVQ